MIVAPGKSDLLLSLIRDRAITPMFQPIVDLNDGMIIAYEALCRPLPERGFAHADDLFHTADELGMSWELEQVTRAVAMDAASDWPRDVRLFLNTSPSVFADDRFARVLRDDLAQARGLTTDQIVLEITERSGTDFGDRLLNQVNLAKECGFTVAVDDAGAGTSGLNRMMQIRPHWIKLDRQLVAGIDQDTLCQNLVRSFVHFARMSGVSVIAEGIERGAELATLMGLGIRFGQGYFLARPADRAATLDAANMSSVREQWASVEAQAPAEPQTMPMVRLCSSVLVVDSGTISITEVAGMLRKNPDSPGVVVTEGRRLVGWCDKRHLLAASTGPDASRPISTLTRAAICALTPDATVLEALQFACTREDDDIALPIIVAAGAEIIGIVPMRELLRAAGAESRPGARQIAALTGLPARVRADQQLEQLIARSRDPAQRNSPDHHTDAAFIDVRKFADYNSLFGYTMGDTLIRALGELLNSCVVRGSSQVFLAHLGDDRFMVTARAGVLQPRLQLLVQTFEQTSAALTDPVRARAESPRPANVGSGPRLGLRVLHLPSIFDRATHPREIYRVEQQLRQKARNQENSIGAGESLLITDARTPTTTAVARLSA